MPTLHYKLVRRLRYASASLFIKHISRYLLPRLGHQIKALDRLALSKDVKDRLRSLCERKRPACRQLEGTHIRARPRNWVKDIEHDLASGAHTRELEAHNWPTAPAALQRRPFARTSSPVVAAPDPETEIDKLLEQLFTLAPPRANEHEIVIVLGFGWGGLLRPI
jgi:hypothetical protein